jgi:MFS family permease
MVDAKQRYLFDKQHPAEQEAATRVSWRALLTPRWMLSLSVLLGGVLLHSMNVLITATLLPSVVVDVGGADVMSWTTTAFVASSIIAATGTRIFTAAIGARRSFSTGAAIYCAGAMLCGLAPSMPLVIAGRFVQGFGGGLLSAVAYVLVRNVFPAVLWPRVFGLLAGVWSASTLCGPLIGGLFAGYGFWRGAFFAVAALGSLLSVLTLYVLPRDAVEEGTTASPAPVLRVALVCAGIAMLSSASVVSGVATKVAFIAAAIAAFSLMMRVDRSAPVGLLPSDAFSLHSATGIGLWMVLLVSIAYSPLFIFGPLFLQKLHELSPLAAGYVIAAAPLSWTAAAIGVASLPGEWPARTIVAGPLSMGVGLLGLGTLMASAPVAALVPSIALIGGGIGACWAFIAQRVMSGARQGEENTAASSVVTVQQAGLALGAAAAGLVANAGGLSDSLLHDSILRAAFWVPASFIAAPLAAGAMGIRLNVLTPRAD